MSYIDIPVRDIEADDIMVVGNGSAPWRVTAVAPERDNGVEVFAVAAVEDPWVAEPCRLHLQADDKVSVWL